MFINVNIFGEFGEVIRNHHEKSIEISTNMPSIGLEIPEIAFQISEYIKKVEKCLHGKTNDRLL